MTDNIKKKPSGEAQVGSGSIIIPPTIPEGQEITLPASTGLVDQIRARRDGASAENPLIVPALHCYTGETNTTILFKCVKHILKLVKAHNLLIEELEKLKQNQDPTKYQKIEPQSVGMPGTRSIRTTTPQPMDFANLKRMSDMEQRAFYVQWKWYCKCVAPKLNVADRVTIGPQSFVFCLECNRPIIEDCL